MQQYTWIYSLNEALSAAQNEALSAQFQAFSQNWKSHGTPVEGNVNIHYQRFIIVQADMQSERPSGCSIDSMRKTVENVLNAQGLSYTDAAQIYCRNAENEIVSVNFREISALLEKGEMNENTLVFDNTLSNSDDLSKWEVPLGQTWLKRFCKVSL
jgi:hypothetical protein